VTTRNAEFFVPLIFLSNTSRIRPRACQAHGAWHAHDSDERKPGIDCASETSRNRFSSGKYGVRAGAICQFNVQRNLHKLAIPCKPATLKPAIDG
jgi:hypothetical protein